MFQQTREGELGEVNHNPPPNSLSILRESNFRSINHNRIVSSLGGEWGGIGLIPGKFSFFNFP